MSSRAGELRRCAGVYWPVRTGCVASADGSLTMIMLGPVGKLCRWHRLVGVWPTDLWVMNSPNRLACSRRRICADRSAVVATAEPASLRRRAG
jgi:hypothetical protein